MPLEHGVSAALARDHVLLVETDTLRGANTYWIHVLAPMDRPGGTIEVSFGPPPRGRPAGDDVEVEGTLLGRSVVFTGVDQVEDRDCVRSAALPLDDGSFLRVAIGAERPDQADALVAAVARILR